MADVPGRAQRATARQVEYLLTLQQPESGHFEAELEANDTLTAEWIFLQRCLGCLDATRERAAARWIASRQQADGGWRLFPGGAGDLSTTVECRLALELVGEPVHEPHRTRASAFIAARGPAGRTRMLTKIWLALLGRHEFRQVPALPAGIMLLPPRFPLGIDSLASWARSVVVPLTVIFAHEGRSVGPLRPLERRALLRAHRWILEHQEPSGEWGGIFPAMAFSLLALARLGHGLDTEPMRKGLAAVDRFAIWDRVEDTYRMQSCVSPVWDTALSLTALLDAGLSPDHPALARAAEWLLDQEIRRHGDWAARARRGTPAGGWAFEHANTWYPDIDDTSVVVMALDRMSSTATESARQAACTRAVAWVLGMQSPGGGWAAFDCDNGSRLWRLLPLADYGQIIDPPTADITGRVLELLGSRGFDARHPAVRRALRFLRRQQCADGAWPGRWGVNYLYGTPIVLAGLRSVGIDALDPLIGRGAAFLSRTQNGDGGWGESPDSDALGRFVPAPSTPSQTAWALLGLIAAGLPTHETTRRGIEWLVDHQRPGGGWDEEAFTGTGFPRDFYIRYHLYRDHFPLMALGRWLTATRAAGGLAGQR